MLCLCVHVVCCVDTARNQIKKEEEKKNRKLRLEFAIFVIVTHSAKICLCLCAYLLHTIDNFMCVCVCGYACLVLRCVRCHHSCIYASNWWPDYGWLRDKHVKCGSTIRNMNFKSSVVSAVKTTDGKACAY